MLEAGDKRTEMAESAIRGSINTYLQSIVDNKSLNTVEAYRNALNGFIAFLQDKGVAVDSLDASQLCEEWIIDFFSHTKRLSPSTQNVYFWGLIGWFQFLVSEKLANIDVPLLMQRIRPYLQKYSHVVPQPPNYYEISRIVDHAINLVDTQASDEYERLRLLRDRAVIVTLADAGLEVGQICGLRRRDIDWRRSRFILHDKNGRDVVIPFSPRVSAVLQDYLNARATYDDAMVGCSKLSLPVFSGHRPRDGKKVLPLRDRAIREIVAKRAKESLGVAYDASITPKSFRRYSSASLLQPLASLHPRISEKCRIHFENGQYDDAIFNAMKVIEEEVRTRISADPMNIGVNLITQAMNGKPPLISFSPIPAEQEAAYFLFRGAIGSFKNPHSHRFVGVSDPVKTFECLVLASLLMRMLDETT